MEFTDTAVTNGLSNLLVLIPIVEDESLGTNITGV
jgi:hypothetical protein